MRVVIQERSIRKQAIWALAYLLIVFVSAMAFLWFQHRGHGVSVQARHAHDLWVESIFVVLGLSTIALFSIIVYYAIRLQSLMKTSGETG